MSIIGTIYEDVTSDVAGKIGPWQWLVTFLATVLMVPTIFKQHEDMYLLSPPRGIECIPPQNFEIAKTSFCNVTLKKKELVKYKCEKWQVKFLWIVWLKKTWMIFCDNELQRLAVTMISRLGLVFGCIIYGFISDNFGRKKALILDIVSEAVLSLAITFCNSESWFRLLVFLRSLSGSGSLYIGLILVCEISSNDWRSWLISIVATPRLLAIVSMVPLANSALNMETYNFISSLFGFLIIITLRWTPESPQWLLYNRKIGQAEKIVYKAARTNRIKLSDNFKIRPVNQRAYNCLEDERITLVKILTTYNVIVLILILLVFWALYFFLWYSLYVTAYYGIHVDYKILLVALTITFVFGCLTVFLARILRLRNLLLISILITGTLTAIESFFRCYETLGSVIFSTAFASGVLGHALLINITTRLIATQIRGTLLGCCHAIGQVGAMASYLIIAFNAVDETVFVAVKIGVTLTLVALCFVLPDIDARELPDVVEDMDFFSELSKPLRWATQKTDSPSREEVEMRIYSFGSAGRAQSTSRSNISEERPPAQRIGNTKLWRTFFEKLRRKP